MVRTRCMCEPHLIITLMENAKREVPATSYGIASSQGHARRTSLIENYEQIVCNERSKRYNVKRVRSNTNRERSGASYRSTRRPCDRRNKRSPIITTSVSVVCVARKHIRMGNGKTHRLSTSPLRAFISIRISSSSIAVAEDGVVPGRRCIAEASAYVLVVR